MSVEDELRQVRGSQISLLLPASWLTIDLTDSERRRRAVRALVDTALGRSDEGARLRADLRTHLNRAADQAAAAGGVVMAVSLMTVGDVPLPASMTAYRMPGMTLDESGVELLGAALRESEPESLDIAQNEDGTAVIRRVRVRAGDASLGAQDLPQMLADYWRTLGIGGPTLSVTFSSPVFAAREALLDLFDTIVSSASLVAEDDESADDASVGS